MSGTAAALGGIRVLDLSTGVAGQYCGKLLAGCGADCVLAEPPEGTPTRRMGPCLTSGRSSTRSAMFRHLNQGKSSLVHQMGDGRMQAMTALADVVIRDDATPLPFTLPATVVECVIGEFPRGGPYNGWHGSEMVHQALAGAMYMTGWPDRQPLYGIGHRAYYACGTTAFISVLSALHERASSGLGQVVTATVFESNAAIAQNLVSQYSYNGSYETRRQYPGFLALLQCRDHWMVLFAIRRWEQLCEVFGLEHLLDDERFGQQASRLEHWDVVVAEMQARARQFLAGELVAALQQARISAEVAAPLDTLVSSAQWRDRQMVRTVGGGAGTARSEAALGPPFTVGDTGYCALRPSPVLRRGTAAERAARAIQQRWLQRQAAGDGRTSQAAGSAGKPSSARPGPLSGLRVIDLTTAWAGPFAGRSLAHLGAEVIKIDAPSHTDSWRGAPEGGATRHYPDGDPGKHPWNRCVLFNTQGQGKLSLGLDLKVAGAREILLRLAEASDVLIANFTPGVLDRLGIGYDALVARNPRIVVVEMPAFGPGGPDSDHQGMGKTMEAACGMAALMGYGEGPPVLTGPAYLDPIGGLSAVGATLVALRHRDETGTGCRVEVPQTEVGAHWIGEYVLLQAETGRSWQPDGNAVADAAPHDAYPCRGDDEWIAIAIGTDGHWRALCQAMRRPDLALSPRYSALPGRARHRHELDAIITRWTKQFSKHELAATLQAAGVPAATVNSGADVARDAVLLETGFIRQLDHPEAGRHAYPGLSYRLERSPESISAAAPCFGQHNEPVLRDILGIRAETIAELQRAGAIADRPLRAQFTTTADAAYGNPTGKPASSPDGPRAHAPDQQRIPMISTTFDYDTIEITVDDAVATITLNRPDQLNAWDWQMHRELRTAYAALDASDDVRVIILTGAGRAFCAGAALAPKGETFDGSRDPAAWNERYPGPALDAPELMTPVIAAINGAAVGAGITMAVSCDIRIAAENAKIGFVFNRRGVVPDADLLWSLPRMIGYARAMDLLLTGRIFTGKEAAEIGLVSRAVPQENVLAVATEMARDIAENVAPASAAITKQVARQFLEETDRKAALERERILFRWAGQQPDAREGVEAFLQRRPAQWRLSKHATLPPEATVDR